MLHDVHLLLPTANGLLTCVQSYHNIPYVSVHNHPNAATTTSRCSQPALTNHASKGLHHQTGPHHNQQICLLHIGQAPPVEPCWQWFPKENYIRLHKPSAAGTCGNIIVIYCLLHGVYAA
eukprot:GHUV01054670.1.p1 GENE.GHUV01054670.1~~GHUV01054670.1.p1  ORF type:complete len:120 (+),score=12.84 GHUV01054670.1:127-486(+)